MTDTMHDYQGITAGNGEHDAPDLRNNTAAELDELGARLRFGDLPNQNMPMTWAETMLRIWRERSPAQWGEYLTEAATGFRKVDGRSKTTRGSQE